MATPQQPTAGMIFEKIFVQKQTAPNNEKALVLSKKGDGFVLAIRVPDPEGQKTWKFIRHIDVSKEDLADLYANIGSYWDKIDPNGDVQAKETK